jgi:lipopolysaccharide export LptBFGC system permease protein LptF
MSEPRNRAVQRIVSIGRAGRHTARMFGAICFCFFVFLFWKILADGQYRGLWLWGVGLLTSLRNFLFCQ